MASTIISSLTEHPSSTVAPQVEPNAESSAFHSSSSLENHRGPHRDGFSVLKCRDVLVRHCSWIPRNYIFKDGLNRVYEILRNYLGDENMDLAIGQLNELIEIPSQWTHDEGAAFQAWKSDYMLRYKDFENSHVPRLGNIIVAPIVLTERLKRWRDDHPGQQYTCSLSSQLSRTPPNIPDSLHIAPDFGIGAGARANDWRLDNSFFISSKAQGTRVLLCPSAEELHKKTWNEDFGRGGKLVQERTIVAVDAVDRVDSQSPTTSRFQESSMELHRTWSSTTLRIAKRVGSKQTVSRMVRQSFPRKFSCRARSRESKSSDAPQSQTKFEYNGVQLTREVKEYESDPRVKSIPDPNTETGRTYFRTISTWPLPPGLPNPNPRFFRKHCLLAKEVPLPENLGISLVPTANEMAIQKFCQDRENSLLLFSGMRTACLNGPLTPELFKDSGIDFPLKWENIGCGSTLEPLYNVSSSVLGLLGDSSQTSSRDVNLTSQSMEGLPPCTAWPSATAPRQRFLARLTTSRKSSQPLIRKHTESKRNKWDGLSANTHSAHQTVHKSLLRLGPTRVVVSTSRDKDERLQNSRRHYKQRVENKDRSAFAGGDFENYGWCQILSVSNGHPKGREIQRNAVILGF